MQNCVIELSAIQEEDGDGDVAFVEARQALEKQKASLEEEQAARFKLPGPMQEAIFKVRFYCLSCSNMILFMYQKFSASRCMSHP